MWTAEGFQSLDRCSTHPSPLKVYMNPFCSSTSLSLKCKLIENRTFYNLRGHYILDKEIVIRDCRFFGGNYTFELNHDKAFVHRCKFVKNTGVGPVILINKGLLSYFHITNCKNAMWFIK